MNETILWALSATLGTWGLTALGAATVVFFSSPNRKLLNLALGFAAGVMIAASFWSLLEPAIEQAEAKSSIPAYVIATSGFLLGAIFMWASDKIVTMAQKKAYSQDAAYGTSMNRIIMLILFIKIQILHYH